MVKSTGFLSERTPVVRVGSSAGCVKDLDSTPVQPGRERRKHVEGHGISDMKELLVSATPRRTTSQKSVVGFALVRADGDGTRKGSHVHALIVDGNFSPRGPRHSAEMDLWYSKGQNPQATGKQGAILVISPKSALGVGWKSGGISANVTAQSVVFVHLVCDVPEEAWMLPGRKKRARKQSLQRFWGSQHKVVRSPGHPFSKRFNAV